MASHTLVMLKAIMPHVISSIVLHIMAFLTCACKCDTSPDIIVAKHVRSLNLLHIIMLYTDGRFYNLIRKINLIAKAIATAVVVAVANSFRFFIDGLSDASSSANVMFL